MPLKAAIERIIYSPFFITHPTMFKVLPAKAIALFILLSTFFLVSETIGQPFQIQESATFPVFNEGELKIMLLGNGNTAFVHRIDENFNYQLYNSDRKVIVQQVFTPKSFDHRRGGIVSLFLVGSDIVLFYGVNERLVPVLYRIIIDSNSGKIVKEEEIGRSNKLKGTDLYALSLGNAQPAGFYIRKDKNSDHYAVGLFNSFESDRNKRIEIRHYNGKHEVINQAFYLSPNNEFKYLELVDFIVMGGEKVIACAYAFNTGDEKASSLFLAQLQKGSSSIQAKQLDFTEDLHITNGVLRRVPGTDLVALLSLAKLDSKRGKNIYGAFLSFLNAKTLALEYNKTIDIPGLRETYKNIFGPKSEYNGVPQNLYVNEDGTYTLVFEEISTVGTSTVLGSTGICVLDKNAKEIYNYITPKIHSLEGVAYRPMYIREREERPQWAGWNEYKSFAYVNSANKKYIFFNDLVENLENLKKSKINNVYTITDTDAFSFALSDGKVDRQFLFGQPERKCHAYAMFAVSDYDPRSGTYVTLRVNNCKDKKMQVIWMNLK